MDGNEITTIYVDGNEMTMAFQNGVQIFGT